MRIKLAVWSFIALTGVFIYKVVEAAQKPFVPIRNLTVLISQESLLGGGRGTGILIDQTHVLTCAHMVHSSKDEFLIYTYPLGKVIKAKAETGDSYADLAILVLESSATAKPFKAPVFQTKVEEGDNVTIIGNALGSMKWLITKGTVSGWEQGFLLSDAHIQHGNSGGPWVNDKGDVVALTDWLIEPPEGSIISGGISAKTIKRFLKQWKEPSIFEILQMMGGR